ncbi:hypothetical protein CLOAM0813 [Candidatus Cloacimonas acidaminovorans str. Evry]|uniref:Uncharacterized protein n=1 Tax=Cloacimonas acidaminovorans (strain Evry) TaxID=459349 RepID=B0VH80_CLOAI|nr:hypothetical protein CLOAM0813 [Candidatus Cloacimonas acidaminovorans str. Evry]
MNRRFHEKRRLKSSISQKFMEEIYSFLPTRFIIRFLASF